MHIGVLHTGPVKIRLIWGGPGKLLALLNFPRTLPSEDSLSGPRDTRDASAASRPETTLCIRLKPQLRDSQHSQ